MRLAEAVRQAEMVMRSLQDSQAIHSTRPWAWACAYSIKWSLTVCDTICQRRPRQQHSTPPSASRTFTAARLDDEDIFATHALLNLHSRLAPLELVEQHFGTRYAEVAAYRAACPSAAGTHTVYYQTNRRGGGPTRSAVDATTRQARQYSSS